MHRRRFLAGAGGTALAGLAGCAGILGGDGGDDVSIVTVEAAGASSPAISGDGDLLAYASDGDEAIVVEAVAPRESVREIALEGSPDSDSIGGVAFSPNGQYLAVVNTGGDARTVHAIDTETWERTSVASFTSWAADGLAFSPDGEHLVVGRGHGDVVRFGVGEWESAGTVDGDDWRSYDQAYGTEYFAHTNDAGLHVYRYPEYERLQQFEGDASHGVAISPDDRFVACNQPREGATGELGPDDWVVTVVETEEWTTAATIEGVHGTASDLEFLGTDELVASNRHDGEVLRYDVGDWSLRETHTAESDSTSLSQRSIATAEDTIVLTWDTSGEA